MSTQVSNPHKRERMLLALAAFAAVLMLIPLVWTPAGEPLQLLEWKLQNFIHGSATPAPLCSDVIVLGIDDATLDTTSAFPEDVEKSPALQLIRKGWPFSRAVYADAITKLLDAGARTVALDLMFTGPSTGFPEDDAKLRQVIEKYPNRVVLAASFAESTGYEGLTQTLQKPWDGLVPDVSPPQPFIGFVNYWQDGDQVVRWARFQRSMRNEDAGRSEYAKLDLMASFTSATMRVSGFAAEVPADDRRYLIRFSYPGAYPPFSLHEIFVPEIWESNYGNGAVFKDKIILIGNVTPHYQDFHVTPVGRISGVQVHAQVIGAALNHSYAKLTPAWVTVVGVLLAAMLAWLLVAAWKQPVGVVLALAGGTALAVTITYLAFDKFSVVINSIAPMLAFNTAGVLAIAYDFLLERRQRRRLSDYLTRYFSPDVVALMLRDPEHFRTLQRGANRVTTVLFSDLRGFTTLSEKLTPQELVTRLNQYFNRMVEIIHGHSGGIDKFIGDAIMAVWGWTTKDQSDDSVRQEAIEAVKTTLRMRAKLDELNEEWGAQGIDPLKIGVGIHQGEAVVGDLGSERQFGFTVIGDTVNTSSRLESITKQYGVDNVISQTVWEQVRDLFVCRSTDLVTVKGKTEPTPIFTVLHDKSTPAPNALPIFEEGVRLYRAGKFDDAKAAFTRTAAEGLDDDLTKVYLGRCEDLIAEPPDHWDGVYVMTKK